MKLSELKRGESAKIINIDLEDRAVRRLISVGFALGNTIEFERKAPLGDPQEYYVAGNYIAIRKKEASKIEVEKL